MTIAVDLGRKATKPTNNQCWTKVLHVNVKNSIHQKEVILRFLLIYIYCPQKVGDIGTQKT